MTGFALDKNNDVIIENNQINMVNGAELISQTLRTVIGTNCGEWCLNENEGISLKSFLGKTAPDEETVRSELEQGLLQIDSSLVLTDFSMDFDSKNRTLSVKFTAENGDGESVEVNNIFE